MRILELTVYLVAYDVLSRRDTEWPWHVSRPREGVETSASDETIAELASALAAACAFYIKPVKCLQRAFVATWYLRVRGYACALVVGAHVARKEGHAWVEAGPRVLGDPRNLRRFFQPLTRV